MPISALLPLVTQLLADAPEVIESVKNIWAVVTAKTGPTADQQAEYDRALDEAHRALQAS